MTRPSAALCALLLGLAAPAGAAEKVLIVDAI